MLPHRANPSSGNILTSGSSVLMQTHISAPERENRSVRESTSRAAGASQERLL